MTMLATAQQGLYGVGLALAAAAALYTLLMCAAVLRSRRSAHDPSLCDASAAPRAVSVLKPLCGAEPGLHGALRSFCELASANVQLVCGIQDQCDPAIAVVHNLQREFPQADIETVIDAASHGSSAKVSNLINMARRARHARLIVSDSDIRAPRGCLEAVLAPLDDPTVGIVTCAYRATPGPGIWSELGALFVDEWFIPGVRVAALFGSRSFAFGALIALRRDTLDRIGGFAAISGQLADDYRLGELTRAAGLRTVLAPVAVETFIEEKTARALIAHELRWLRTIRTVQPLGYAFSFVTFGIPVAAIGVLCSGGAAAAWVLFAVTLFARLYLHGHALRLRVNGTVGLRRVLRRLGLILLGDTLGFALWCWSFSSRRVHWRQQCYEVAPDGSMTPVR